MRYSWFICLLASFLFISESYAYEEFNVNGEILLNIAERGYYDDQGNLLGSSYEYLGASPDMELEVPDVIAINLKSSVLGQTSLNWNVSDIWNIPNISVSEDVDIDYLETDWVTGPPGVYSTIRSFDDIIANGGPTEKNFGVVVELGAGDSPGLIDWSPAFGISAAIKFDVSLENGADIAMNQDVELENLYLLSGAVMSGNYHMVINQNVDNFGQLTELAGTIHGDFNNSGYASISNSLTVNGILTNPGEIVLSNRLQLPNPFTNSGIFECKSSSGTFGSPIVNTGLFKLNGGTLGSDMSVDNRGVFEWLAGNIDTSGLINLQGNTITILDGGTKTVFGSLSNFGLMKHYSDESINLYNSTLSNMDSGSIELSGSGGLGLLSHTGNTSSLFYNYGSIHKLGEGQSYINTSFVNDGGTISVEGGILEFAHSRRPNFKSGNYSLANDAILKLTKGLTLYNDIDFLGNGTVISNTIYIQGDETLDIFFAPEVTYDANSSGALVNGNATIKGTNIPWKQGKFSGNISFAEDNSITVLDGGAKTILGSLSNFSLMKHYSDESINLYNSTLSNMDSGSIELSGSGGIGLLSHTGNTSSLFYNYGSIRKLGEGQSYVSPTFVNDGGVISIESGVLEFDRKRPQFKSGIIRLQQGTLKQPYNNPFNYSILEGNGVLDCDAILYGSTIWPNSGTRTIEISGDLEIASDSSYDVDIYDVNTNGFSQLVVNGDAYLDGTLTVVLAPGVRIYPDDQFTILSADSIDGWFDTIEIPQMADGGYLFDITFTDNSIVLTSKGYIDAANIVGNSSIDIIDLAVMAQQWASDFEESDVYPYGGDGIVDLFDFSVIAARWLE